MSPYERAIIIWECGMSLNVLDSSKWFPMLSIFDSYLTEKALSCIEVTSPNYLSNEVDLGCVVSYSTVILVNLILIMETTLDFKFI